MSTLSLHLFGAPRIVLDGNPIHLERRKALALLIYLGVTRKPHTRDFLAALLFEDHNTAEGRGALRRIFSTLNTTLGEHWFTADRDMLALKPGVQVDVTAFEQQIASGEWSAAAALYQGDFLAGFTLPDSPAFEEWQLFQQEHLRQQYIGILEGLVQRSADQPDQALHYARAWLAVDSLHEPAHRAVMQFYAALGQRGAALRQYQDCVRILQRELDSEPSPETTALYERISQTAEALINPLLTSSPVHGGGQGWGSPILGRESEVALIRTRLLDPACRLLTIVGSGGIGKTRLAEQAAAALYDAFPQGSRVIYLSMVYDLDRLVMAINESLGLKEHGCSDAQEILLDYLCGRGLLLVLDNFEQLTGSAKLLSNILNKTTQVKLLVTSRERLRLQGEWLIELHGLSHEDAVALFAQVAQRLNVQIDDWEAVERICDLVEGMPLGIELAAAWIRMLRPAEIAQEIARSAHFLQAPLQDLPVRHRSLTAVFEHSWHLLGDEECSVLRRLSVFRGGFLREAAQQIAGASLPVLLALVDKSLARVNGRFDLHELIRQYAAEKLALDPTEEKQVREQHAKYYLEMVQQQTKAPFGEKVRITPELAAETDNIRKAWRYALQQQRRDWVAQYYDGVHRLYADVGLLIEGEAVMGQAAAVLERGAALAYILIHQGKFSGSIGLHERSAEQLSEALHIFRDLNDPEGIVNALIQLGFTNFNKGDYVQAQTQLEEALQLSQRHGFERGICKALNFLGYNLAQMGELDKGKAMLHESVRLARRLDSLHQISSSLNSLGYVLTLAGEYAEAEAALTEAMGGRHSMGDQFGVIASILNIGYLYIELDNERLARHYFLQALRVCLDTHSVPVGLDALSGMARLYAHAEKYSAAAELIALVLHHPASWMETRHRMESLAAVVETRLPAEVLIEAKSCGRRLKWDEVARRILGEG